MTISYEEALQTLQSMFSPQGYTQQQLDTILRHHGGHMENTVECILVHGEGAPEVLIGRLNNSTAGAGGGGGGGGGGAVNDIDADEELARQLAAEDQRSNASNNTTNYARTTTNNAAAAAARRQQLQDQRRPMASTVSAPKSPPRQQPQQQQQQRAPVGTKGRGTYTTLPPDFLRIPGRSYPPITTTTSSTTTAAAGNNTVNANGMTDEQLARMLQDELFQEELRNNPEFSHLAHGRQQQSQQQRRQQQQQQGPDLLEKLSELGDVAKNRFQAFAAGWNSQNSNNGGGLFGGGGNNHTNNSGPSPRNERRGLLSDLDMDEDEEEMDFIGGSGGGRDVELKSVGRSGDKKTD